MTALEQAEVERFVLQFRKDIADTIDAIRTRFYTENAEPLFAPPTVTAALMLSALDYCQKMGLRPDQFAQALRGFATQLEADWVTKISQQPGDTNGE